MELQDYVENEELLSDSIKKLCEDRNHVRVKIAMLVCPFRLGQTVVDRKGNKAIVQRIGYVDYGQKYSFQIKKLKKNGEPGLRTNNAYNFEKWEAVPDSA